MKGKMFFGIISIIAVFALLVLFTVSSEVWDGACGHKEEFGLFAFYRSGSDVLPASECASGVLIPGALLTLLATLGLLAATYYSWCRLVKGSS
ncbi:hypothetical protein [Gynuella sunshinyii]|uniref:hypothetical protein n=1 Tax=Gynuella sunshinyii TaxID=1445505 RepID=UPI0005CBFA39|nr:hypothetical protein [Gynuella sunshinyii]